MSAPIWVMTDDVCAGAAKTAPLTRSLILGDLVDDHVRGAGDTLTSIARAVHESAPRAL